MSFTPHWCEFTITLFHRNLFQSISESDTQLEKKFDWKKGHLADSVCVR